MSIAEIRTRRNFMGVRRIQQFESLGEQLIGSCIVPGLMTQLGKRNKRLALRLRISACTSKSEGFLRFFLRFVQVVLLLKRFTQSLVCETNEPLFIPHFIKSQATHSIIPRHRQFTNCLITLADLHILLRKALTVTI